MQSEAQSGPATIIVTHSATEEGKDVPPRDTWPLWRRILFRFFFVLLSFIVLPLDWLGIIPGLRTLVEYYYTGFDWLALKLNAWIFHVPRPAVPIQNNGSGDTSLAWAGMFLILTLAVAGAILWSVLDRKRNSYKQLNYWLCLATRYFVIITCFAYGMIKLFALQMPFPTYSNLMTPLGDYLPMRFSWMFMGYSQPYQVFSGAMEVLAGALLLFRRTATLGTLLATGVFLNVAMMNLSYDIPVKLFSITMVACCLFLLANEMRRMLCFFVWNRVAGACNLYDFPLRKRWMRIGRIVLKSIFIVAVTGGFFAESLSRQKEYKGWMTNMPFKAGVYDVVSFAVNGDTVPPMLFDSARWQNLVFDNNRSGSVATTDTAFMRRYNRAYFIYKADTVARRLQFLKSLTDSTPIASFRWQWLDSATLAFTGRRQRDSLYLVLRRNNRHFQLAERQFHWISEANR